jgi:hypothetical protein
MIAMAMVRGSDVGKTEDVVVVDDAEAGQRA